MIGIILLLIALVCYFRKSSRWLSYVLYIGFLSKGYNVLTDDVLGIKNMDLAIVYTFVICLYLWINKRLRLPDIAASLWIKVFAVFMFFSILFSLIHYHFTLYQILQGGRNWLLIFSLPILIRMSRKDFIRVIKILAYITLLTAIVYIAQIVVGHPLLPYGGEGSIDRATGLIRLYNSPPLLVFFIILSFAYSEIFRMVYVWRVVLFVALICTLGRTSIFATIFAVLVAIWLQGRASRLIKAAAVILVLFIPFMDIVTNRYEGAGTSVDLNAISVGKYDESYYAGEGGTMTYRLALLYERADYLARRPLLEKVFGMGLISDSQAIVQKLYKFSIGLRDAETGNVSQLRSPDIAWVNTVCGLGFGGTIIYIVLILSLFVHFFRNRNVNMFYVIISALMLSEFITSFSGSGLSEPRTFAIYFMVMSTAFVYKHRKMIVQNEEIDLKI